MQAACSRALTTLPVLDLQEADVPGILFSLLCMLCCE